METIRVKPHVMDSCIVQPSLSNCKLKPDQLRCTNSYPTGHLAQDASNQNKAKRRESRALRFVIDGGPLAPLSPGRW